MKSVFIVSILFSTLIHGVLLIGYNEWSLSLSNNKEQGSSFLHVEINQNQVIVKKTHTPSTDKVIQHDVQAVAPVITQQTPADHSIAEEKIAENFTPQKSAKTLSPADTEPTYEDRPMEDDLSKSHVQEKISTLLQNEIEKHFYYPKAALRRNWQGDLILTFLITENGAIEDINVTKSSGYKLLDDAAISCVEKIKLHKKLKTLLSAQSIVQQLPVSYKINN